MPTPKVVNLAEYIIHTYVSYGFTDWREAIDAALEIAQGVGTHYEHDEVKEAAALAQRFATKLKAHYDTLHEEIFASVVERQADTRFRE